MKRKNFLLKIAKSSISSFFVGNLFQYLSFLLPVERLYEDKKMMVFYHPQPYWQFHCLAIPKKKIPSFQKLDLSTDAGCNLVKEIFQSLQKISAEKELHDFKIIVNGGNYQDVAQIHFHLGSGNVDDKQDFKYLWQDSNDKVHQRQYRSAILYPCPNPQRETHCIITTEDTPFFPKIDFGNQKHANSLIDILSLAQITISANSFTAYSLISEIVSDSPDPKLCFHLVSGQRKMDCNCP
jgi:histidine triad (HIT) family protein